MKYRHLLVPVLVLLPFLVSCGKPKQAMLESVPEVARVVTEKGEGLQVQINPRVDILFVIDNSSSMETHQVNLSKNINLFVNALNKDKGVDYHIGVVSVYDSLRMGDVDPKTFDANGMLYPKGHLRPLITASNEKLIGLPHYATPDTPLDILARSLKIGVHAYKDGGPEFEESFSPVLAAIQPPLVNLPAHKGFYRGKESHFVVIFVTDAQDSSPGLSGSQFVENLTQLRADNPGEEPSFSLFGILPSAADCKVDPGGAPENIFNMLGSTHVLNLCTNFGDDLASLGAEVRSRTLKKRIRLSYKPAAGTIHVMYGNSEIPNDSVTGWTLDHARNELVIHGIGEAQLKSEVMLEITYEAVNMANVANGHAIPLK